MKHLKLKPMRVIILSCVLLSACATPSEPPIAPSASPTATASPLVSPTASPTASASPVEPTTDIEQIGYGLSYGFCIGYCDHSLTITAERMRLVHIALREPEKNPEQVIEKPTPAETWQKLNSLASFETLQSLPDRVGCPDCADGGAESISLEQAGGNKTVTFEPQAGLPQQAELLAELKQLYQTLNDEQKAANDASSS